MCSLFYARTPPPTPTLAAKKSCSSPCAARKEAQAKLGLLWCSRPEAQRERKREKGESRQPVARVAGARHEQATKFDQVAARGGDLEVPDQDGTLALR